MTPEQIAWLRGALWGVVLSYFVQRWIRILREYMNRPRIRDPRR